MDTPRSETTESPKNYVIIENTPGYLPEDDDPATFDSYAEALNALVEYNKKLSEETEDDEGNKKYDVSAIVNGWFTYTEVNYGPHALGRVVEIVPLTGEDE